ncbi:hypothetical protein OUZ56_028839 [Daphnia magna]|uniref:Uncharacterized protein n=1 Tax=Daphnia magna TaxID=35525 RepID=A0ABR0B523_9CRUS|nr:hypothetical protein OUZ56_028839 [Daphnia magna]
MPASILRSFAVALATIISLASLIDKPGSGSGLDLDGNGEWDWGAGNLGSWHWQIDQFSFTRQKIFIVTCDYGSQIVARAGEKS